MNLDAILLFKDCVNALFKNFCFLSSCGLSNCLNGSFAQVLYSIYHVAGISSKKKKGAGSLSILKAK